MWVWVCGNVYVDMCMWVWVCVRGYVSVDACDLEQSSVATGFVPCTLHPSKHTCEPHTPPWPFAKGMGGGEGVAEEGLVSLIMTKSQTFTILTSTAAHTLLKKALSEPKRRRWCA